MGSHPGSLVTVSPLLIPVPPRFPSRQFFQAHIVTKVSSICVIFVADADVIPVPWKLPRWLNVSVLIVSLQTREGKKFTQ